MDTYTKLDKAITLATAAHLGQRDLVGMPYILHPIRVMLRMQDPESMIVAVLHDVLEDTRISEEQLLQAGFEERLVSIIKMVTRQKDEPYMDYIGRIAFHGWARAVKLADLDDNMSPDRILGLYQSDKFSHREIERRVMKYLKAWSFLKDHE
jgi:GTP diphosphokinase / guanosine-3',5'-bis(diphosphate) 3'-diphosphatase